jgi:fructokinase
MILVVGEALIDLIEERQKPGAFNAIVGGANANVAIALARRGTPQKFLARIAKDRFGKIIRKRLLENGVGLEFAISAAELTTLAVVSIDPNGAPSYSFYVNGTADWAWTPDELPSNAELENLHAKAIQFGCLTMAMQPGNAVIETWAKEHFEQNSVTISHDINMRPALGFEADFERIRVERLNSISHIIKASDEDIEWLYGLDHEASSTPKKIDEIVSGWIAGTNRQVFVTRGSQGVSIYRTGDDAETKRLDVASRKIQVVDTVGAGDTFCANLLGQLFDVDALGTDPFDRLANLSDEAMSEFVRIAGVAASITCERAGAEPPTKAELETVLHSI